MPAVVDLSPIYDFLPCRTPEAWLSAAVESLPLLMIDHANCEKKAAATAMSLMHRYTDNTTLLNKMSRLAREELRHFEQVLKLMTKRGIAYESVTASRYAQGLREKVRKKRPPQTCKIPLSSEHLLRPVRANDFRRCRHMLTPS